MTLPTRTAARSIPPLDYDVRLMPNRRHPDFLTWSNVPGRTVGERIHAFVTRNPEYRGAVSSDELRYYVHGLLLHLRSRMESEQGLGVLDLIDCLKVLSECLEVEIGDVILYVGGVTIRARWKARRYSRSFRSLRFSLRELNLDLVS